MELSTFCHTLAQALELDQTLTGEQVLAEASWWDSMAVLVFIAFADSNYGRSMNIGDLADAKTVGDLYRIANPNA